MEKIFRFDSIRNNDLLIVAFLIFGILCLASLGFFIAGKIKPKANLDELKARTKSWWVMSSGGEFLRVLFCRFNSLQFGCVSSTVEGATRPLPANTSRNRYGQNRPWGYGNICQQSLSGIRKSPRWKDTSDLTALPNEADAAVIGTVTAMTRQIA